MTAHGRGAHGVGFGLEQRLEPPRRTVEEELHPPRVPGPAAVWQRPPRRSVRDSAVARRYDRRVNPAERVLVVDGDCPMCMGFAGGLIRLRLIAPEARRPLQTLEPELAERALAAGVRNEIVALDPTTPALVPILAP